MQRIDVMRVCTQAHWHTHIAIVMHDGKHTSLVNPWPLERLTAAGTGSYT